MLFIDLDDFKGVNDLYGHAAGDALLIALSRRLVATVRPADTVARLGGDEFVVVCEGIDESTAIALGHRLTEAINEPMDVDGVEHRLSASIGIALGAAGRRDPDGLLADADAAAYRAKAEGRGRVEVFDTRLRRHARERLRTAAALERALSLGQLRLAFQPIVRLGDGSVVGHEALLRWDSPGRRDVGAGGLHRGRRGVRADRRDRRLDADAGVPRERGGARRRRRRAGRRRQPVAPPARASRPSRRWSPTACAPAGCPGAGCGSRSRRPCCWARPRPRGATWRSCARMGVGLVLDDFGTGYSSLRDLPVAAVKIDRSFVGRLGTSAGDTAIVSAIVSLAHALGIDAIAEGVEHEAQAERLRELGCELAQGYLFGAPGTRITSGP